MQIGTDNDPKLRAKYPFIWKPLEEWQPSERRWKWVKKECLPLDLKNLLYKPEKEGKKEKEKVRVEGPNNENEAKEEFMTIVNTQQWLQDDYRIIVNVRDNLEALKQQRLKGKFDSKYHA